MSRELPLLIGAIGAVLGVLAIFPGLAAFGYVAIYHPTGSNFGFPFLIVWVISPCFGLAGAFTVKKHGKLGGILFLTASLLPWIYDLLVSPNANPLFFLLLFFWTPLVVLAGILALLDWPGPYVDPEDGRAVENRSVPNLLKKILNQS